MSGTKRKFDEPEPESNKRLSTVIANHYNSILEKGIASRKESRIYYMRAFNNWVKAVIIAQALNQIETKNKEQNRKKITVLDIGCGKGGDLRKYRLHGVANLVCVDIASESLNQCQERYKEMDKQKKNSKEPLFKAFFIEADATRDNLNDKLKSTEGLIEQLGEKDQFDLVSSQFTFHYCFESLPQAEKMIKNISNNLRSGGFFIGTTPDAYYIVSKARKQGPSFGNEVYTVTFEDSSMSKNDKKIPLFGARYNFHLDGCVDCPEFLVHFPTFEKIALKYGLKLLFKRRFEDFYEENRKKGEESDLLGKMGALETFPSNDLKGPPGDYNHARQFLNQQERQIRKVGTLSQSEWEAINLYLVFVFCKL